MATINNVDALSIYNTQCSAVNTSVIIQTEIKYRCLVMGNARHYFSSIFTAIYGNNSLFSVRIYVLLMVPPIECQSGYQF